MALFASVDMQRPLPEIIADGGQDWSAFSLQFQDVEGKRYYAVQDWLRGVALTEDASRFWADLKRRLQKAGIQLFAPCVQLKYLASNGKAYNMDFAPAEGLYAITQRMDTDTGIRNRILAYLVHAGAIVDEQRLASASQPRALPKNVQKDYALWLEQGKTHEEAYALAEKRVSAIDVRNRLTAVLNAVCTGKIKYGVFTDTEYCALFNGRTAQDLRTEIGVSKLRGAGGLTGTAQALIWVAEEQCQLTLAGRVSVTFGEACEIMRQCSEPLGDYLQRMSVLTGVDSVTGISRVTGRPMLPSGA